jgi:hypothetical protein
MKSRKALAVILQTLFVLNSNVLARPVPVEVRMLNGTFELLRDGEPYYINGAVFWSRPDGPYPMKYLKKCGANSIRTGGRNIENALDEAENLDLTVTIGLPIAKEYVDGFDYNDQAAVARQHERIRQMVLKYKDHPALIIWGVGNEWSYGHKNEKVFDAVEAACKMIKEIDPYHPTMTAQGDNPWNKEFFQKLKEKCPSLDILGVNVYGGLLEVPAKLREFGWNKPYIFSEWGPTGHWQVEDTEWDASIEQTSTEKAEIYKKRYEEGIMGDVEMCLGSYVFFWAQKQEYTHTWFGMFLEDGTRTETVNVMQYLWSGQWPENRAPRVDSITLEGKKAVENVYLKPGTEHSIKVAVVDPEGDTLNYEWEILPEPKVFGYAGRGEKKPAPVEGLFKNDNTNKLVFTAPEKEDAYRAFVTIYDGNGNAGTANFPFYVRP